MSLLAQLQRFVDKFSGNPPPTKIERRTESRTIAMQRGFITFPKRPAFPPSVCMIKDVSKTGAKIEIVGKSPDESLFDGGFNLYIETRDHERECQPMWRRAGEIGVKFVGPILSPSRAYAKLG